MPNRTQRATTGIAELDEILSGGFIPANAYLVRGGPGQGKTTLGLHFLSAGGRDQPALFIGFQETEAQLKANAATLGIDVTGIDFLSLVPDEQFFTAAQGYDVFSAADVEAEPLAAALTEAVERVSPKRVFIDSMTQLRFLAPDLFQYRKQVLSLLRFLRDRGATVVFSSERSRDLPDDDLQFIADGVISLGSAEGAPTLEVTKFRGSGFRRGPHQYRVGGRGLEVFPRPLPPRAVLERPERIQWRTGVGRLDAMLEGGIEAGTITLITGPSGTGKSTLASLFVAEAGRAGRRAAFFAFEEEVGNLLARCESLRIPLRQLAKDGTVSLEQVEPMRFLVDEFARHVQAMAAERGLDMVVLDSIAGYELTLGQSDKAAVHALAKSLSRSGVTVILVNEVEAVTGQFRISERGISYLADNVLIMRYMEVDGRLQKVFGILKKRLSSFDRRLFPFEVGPDRIAIREPEEPLHGVLSGQLLPLPPAPDQ